jgi:hypothetical protein
MLRRDQQGIIAMITVVVIGAMILSVGISAALIGQTEIILSGHTDREYAARSLATACVEEALHRLKLNAGYAGGTVPVGAESCSVTVTGSGAGRTITATASSAEFTKSISVTASLRQNSAGNARAWHIDAWAGIDPP